MIEQPSSLLSGLVLLRAGGVVLHRNTVHSSLFLGLSLAGVAGLFACLGADFLFAAQVMVYVSGIAVLVAVRQRRWGRASTSTCARSTSSGWPPS